MARPYRLGKRGDAVIRTREQLVASARALLSKSGFHRLGLADVAREAGVTRVTVYNQFRSKLGLLEAVLDDVGVRGDFRGLIVAATTEPDPRRAFHRFLDAHGRFWASDRLLLRRIVGLSAADPEAAGVLSRYESGRRRLVGGLVDRLERAGALTVPREHAVASLMVLTSFGTFDLLAGESGSVDAAIALLVELASPLVRRIE